MPLYGWFLSGRYFLPAILGLAMVMAHSRPVARGLFLLALGAFHVACVDKTLSRYFSGRWGDLVASLPFVAPSRDARTGEAPMPYELLFDERLSGARPAEGGGAVESIVVDGALLTVEGWLRAYEPWRPGDDLIAPKPVHLSGIARGAGEEPDIVALTALYRPILAPITHSDLGFRLVLRFPTAALAAEARKTLALGASFDRASAGYPLERHAAL